MHSMDILLAFAGRSLKWIVRKGINCMLWEKKEKEILTGA